MKFRRLFLIGLGFACLLIPAGLLVYRQALNDLPSVLPGLAGALLVLAGYGLAAVFALGAVQRRDERILTWAGRLGLLAGIVFTAEILLEYILLPADNSRWGLVEFGLVFALYLAAAFLVAWKTDRISNGLLASLWTAMAASLVWLAAVLILAYVFHGSARQELVFRAEGNYLDFQHSGMTNFEAFILGDFYGAAFYHLLLIAPLASAILGLLGAGLGKLGTKLSLKS